MPTLFLTLIIFLAIVLLMAVGFIFKKKELKGSCGGISALGMEKMCDCEEPCDNLKAKAEAGDEQAKAELAQNFNRKTETQFYDASKTSQNNLADQVRAALLGLAIGDALGVPVEFCKRKGLAQNPVVDMRSYGTYKQPAGTWSDDTSLTLCFTESLIEGFDLNRTAKLFLKWIRQAHWTAHQKVFDIGIATRNALAQIALNPDLPVEQAGGKTEGDNGNGSLMRILPLAFFVRHLPIEQRFQLTKLSSAITHAHIRSVIACFYYVEFALGLINHEEKTALYQRLQQELPDFLRSQNVSDNELSHFDRLLKQSIWKFDEELIKSTGYVIHTLEASIWCLFNSLNYSETVLKAVNLGEDTDTTAAVAGGLAGLLYGENAIPLQWKKQLARIDDIIQLAEQFSESLNKELK